MRLPKGHPIREMLDMAAVGRQPTKGELNALAERDDVPDGASLALYRDKVSRACAELVELHKADGGTARSKARAWEHADKLGATMSEAQLGIRGEANSESLDDLARRMFSH